MRCTLVGIALTSMLVTCASCGGCQDRADGHGDGWTAGEDPDTHRSAPLDSASDSNSTDARRDGVEADTHDSGASHVFEDGTDDGGRRDAAHDTDTPLDTAEDTSSCASSGESCTSKDDCCEPLVCEEGSCETNSCKSIGEECQENNDCCSASCATNSDPPICLGS